MISLVVIAVLLGLALAGALMTVFAHEVLRLSLGLGVLLVVVAGIFLFYSAPFLAIAQVFVYAGGVLVLLLFALMLLRRNAKGRLVLEQRHDVGAAVVSIAVFVLIGIGYSSLDRTAVPTGVPIESISAALLGPYLPHFEAAALLLLVALVGALTIALPARDGRSATGGAALAGPNEATGAAGPADAGSADDPAGTARSQSVDAVTDPPATEGGGAL